MKKIINRTKFEVFICEKEVKPEKGIRLSDDDWKKEFDSRKALRDAVNREEITIENIENKTTKKKK